MRRWLAILAGILCLASNAFGALAPAQEEAELEKGRRAYREKSYSEAAARFAALTKPGSEVELKTPGRIADAHFYLGATQLALGNAQKADEEFLWVHLDGVRREDTYAVDGTVFSRAVQDAFDESSKKHSLEILAERRRVAQEKEAKRIREEQEKERQKRYVAALEKQAAEEVIVTKRSRWLTFVPFGVGQFQNGQTILGLTFLGTETAFLAASVVTWGLFLYNKNEYDSLLVGPRRNDPNAPDLIPQYRDRMNAAIYGSYVVMGGFALSAIAGIVQANLAFTPETRTTKPRALPQVTWSIGPGGIGIEGRF